MDRQSVRLPLPPKRFELAEDPAYDPIRHKKWFGKMAKRDKEINLMKVAYNLLTFDKGDTSITEMCKSLGICERVFRDYRRFSDLSSAFNRNFKADPVMQRACNIAYSVYQNDGARKSFTWYLTQSAKDYGIRPILLVGLWENDPRFKPTQISSEKE